MMTVETEIQITRAGDEPGEKTLKVEIPVNRVQAAEHKAALSYAKRARLPGFRPGKAPIAVVKKRYRDAIKESALQELVGESWKLAVDREQLKPIADPRVRQVTFADGEPMTFELIVAVKPEIELGRVSGFTLTRSVRPVTDDLVGKQLEDLRRQRAPWSPMEGGRAAPGDLVSVTIATMSGGEPSDPRQYQIVLGEGRAMPGVEEKILELSPGETGTTMVRFPDEFHDEALRGQERGVQITLHEVKRQDLPALDDAFAQEVDFESLAALRDTVRQDLEAEARREADAALRQQLMEQIISANGLEAPRPMVQQVLRAFAEAYEVPDDRLEEFTKEFGPIAERQVQRDLVLDYVAEQEHLLATEADMDARIEEIARRRKAEPAQIYTSLQKAGRLKELERQITEEKVFTHLLEQSTIKDA